jgi:hypothetical protein
MLIGTGLSIMGNLMGNFGQAKGERANAGFYARQAQYALEAGARETDLANIRGGERIGRVTSGYAGANVDIGSGSAAAQIGLTAARRIEELKAIKKKTELDFTLATGRANSSTANADMLESFGYNALQATGSALTGASKFQAAGGKLPSWLGGE